MKNKNPLPSKQPPIGSTQPSILLAGLVTSATVAFQSAVLACMERCAQMNPSPPPHKTPSRSGGGEVRWVLLGTVLPFPCFLKVSRCCVKLEEDGSSFPEVCWSQFFGGIEGRSPPTKGGLARAQRPGKVRGHLFLTDKGCFDTMPGKHFSSASVGRKFQKHVWNLLF